MRTNQIVAAAVGVLAIGCDGYVKDSGSTVEDGETEDTPYSLDLGRCPTEGLALADELPLMTVRFEAGEFEMGNRYDDDSNAAPSHSVTLERAFEMSVTEITQGQWMGLGLPNPSQKSDCSDCPVEQVTWHEAVAFAEALNAVDGLDPCATCTGTGAETVCTPPADPYACTGWRLPTEAEWEWAAGVDGGVWAGSDDFADVAWTVEAVGEPCPVGILASTSAGVYDLSGNVSEWVYDTYAAYTADAEVNPAVSGGTAQVVRGGSSFQVADEARITVRDAKDPMEAVPWRGFRLVKSAEPLVDDGG